MAGPAVMTNLATPVGAAPSDAVVLFDGSGLAAWESEQGGDAPGCIAGHQGAGRTFAQVVVIQPDQAAG